MDELHTIKNESLASAKIRITSTNIDHGKVDSLQTKIKLLDTENKLLKDDIKNKQNPAGIYLLKVNNRNTRTRCEICSKLTIKIPVLVSLLLTLNKFHTFF